MDAGSVCMLLVILLYYPNNKIPSKNLYNHHFDLNWKLPLLKISSSHNRSISSTEIYTCPLYVSGLF